MLAPSMHGVWPHFATALVQTGRPEVASSRAPSTLLGPLVAKPAPRSQPNAQAHPLTSRATRTRADDDVPPGAGSRSTGTGARPLWSCVHSDAKVHGDHGPVASTGAGITPYRRPREARADPTGRPLRRRTSFRRAALRCPGASTSDRPSGRSTPRPRLPQARPPVGSRGRPGRGRIGTPRGVGRRAGRSGEAHIDDPGARGHRDRGDARGFGRQQPERGRRARLAPQTRHGAPRLGSTLHLHHPSEGPPGVEPSSRVPTGRAVVVDDRRPRRGGHRLDDRHRERVRGLHPRAAYPHGDGRRLTCRYVDRQLNAARLGAGSGRTTSPGTGGGAELGTPRISSAEPAKRRLAAQLQRRADGAARSTGSTLKKTSTPERPGHLVHVGHRPRRGREQHRRRQQLEAAAVEQPGVVAEDRRAGRCAVGRREGVEALLRCRAALVAERCRVVGASSSRRSAKTRYAVPAVAVHVRSTRQRPSASARVAYSRVSGRTNGSGARGSTATVAVTP